MTPLYVDLDGSLIRCDSLEEGALKMLRKEPLSFLKIPFWLLKGKAYLKEQVSLRSKLSPSDLPYNEPVLTFLKSEHAKGRKLILATAAHEDIAQAIVDHLGIFSGYIATSGDRNLSGSEKLKRILEDGGEFAYLGNAHVDLPLWAHAKEAIVVNAPASVVRRAKALCSNVTVIDDRPHLLKIFLKMIRVHQWSKNVLLYLPLLLTPQFVSLSAIIDIIAAFMGFSLVASSVYLLNDLVDIDTDRKHPLKRNRPIAAGRMSLITVIGLFLLFMMSGMMISWLVSLRFFGMVVIYMVTTTLYSFKLKKLLVIDVLTLSLLYTMRILAGGIACAIPVSFWLISFSWFFFAGLALAKRSAELHMLKKTQKKSTSRRGYEADDLLMVNNIGVGFSTASIVVFSLYIDSSHGLVNYATPEFLWGMPLLLSFWLGRLWILIGRGEMHHDPVVFALRDRPSYVVVLLGMLFMMCAFFLPAI